MSYELANPSPVTLAQIVDDLQTYHETLEMLEASHEKSRLSGTLDAEEVAIFHNSIAECRVKIEAIGAALADKTDAIAAVLRRIDAEQEMVKSEEVRLRGRRKTLEKAGDWLRHYVLTVMDRNEVKQLKTATNTIFTRSTEAVVILDAAKVPMQWKDVEIKLPKWAWEYMRDQLLLDAHGVPIREVIQGLRPVESIPLTPIKKAIKAGEEVPGADLKFNASLVVR